MKSFSSKIVQLLTAIQCQDQVLVNAFWGNSSDNPIKRSKSILPVLDESFHGTSHFSRLSIDEIINLYGTQQAKQTTTLTKLNENKLTPTCVMMEGPNCFPTEKYYGHSKLHYPTGPSAQRDPTAFGHLWSHATKYAQD